tara:strand:+ start:150 stop:884 length:735 start_codon:yes stop_codon:yes gene_type:complete
MSIVEDLYKKVLEPKLVALPPKQEIPEEISNLKENYFDKFGIHNDTSAYINTKLNNIKSSRTEAKKEFANNEVLKNITDAFKMYKIVDYKQMDSIAKDHNLYMTGLFQYKKAIPELNLEELNDFTSFLKDIDPNVLKSLYVIRNGDFIFNWSNTCSIEQRDLSNLFFIMAPKSHLKVSKECKIIGREISHLGEMPKFKYEFKVNRPEPVDPIIFVPFKILDTIYCVIVTAWDKVADDLRIRQMI